VRGYSTLTNQMPEALGVFRASDLSFFGRGAGSLAERERSSPQLPVSFWLGGSFGSR